MERSAIAAVRRAINVRGSSRTSTAKEKPNGLGRLWSEWPKAEMSWAEKFEPPG
jgi:hypothetical protein